MKLTYLNKVSRCALLEVLIATGEDTVVKLQNACASWEASDGAAAPQVTAHFRRELDRQVARVKKLREELDELLKQVPSGWRCGHRSSVSAWDCKLHAGHRGDHYYGEGKQG